ncbi:hypothetical protein GMDG_04228 [Pseudogymnoascus destructans 20631-21]|uniref:Uncharacterized protein n=1 Tax=Pseudogymnoascus destructans (strain ATCC MYA-4855 / 20631-21) TaxID=658429 RepID=L8G9K2_PSED2|nr:hypothetical protein GMDG_04228 [Pseudogymnoascus destructans 20631-21]
MIAIVRREPHQAAMPAMRPLHDIPRVGGIRRDQVYRRIIDMADGVRARPHRPMTLGHRALPYLGGRGRAAGALAAVPRPRRRRGGHMQLLLVAQEQVPPREAARALGALERLLLGVGALVALEMLEPRKRARAGRADVWPGLVGLGRGEGRRRLWVQGGINWRAKVRSGILSQQLHTILVESAVRRGICSAG